MKHLWLILFVIPLFAQDPCSTKEFLRLRDISINDKSSREFQYFMLMSERCSNDAKKSSTVYLTRTGSKYHKENCRYLSKSKIPIKLVDVSPLHLPCSVCKPPTLSQQNQSIKQNDQKKNIVFVTRTGSKYHRSGCRYLRKSSIPKSLVDAKKGYSPCSVCKPPYR